MEQQEAEIDMPEQIERFYSPVFIAVTGPCDLPEQEQESTISTLLAAITKPAPKYVNVSFVPVDPESRSERIAALNASHAAAGIRVALASGEDLCQITNELFAVLIPLGLMPGDGNPYIVFRGDVLSRFLEALEAKRVFCSGRLAVFGMFLWGRTSREKLLTDDEFALAVQDAFEKEQRKLQSWKFRFNEATPIAVTKRIDTGEHVALPPIHQIPHLEPSEFEDFVVKFLKCLGVTDVWATPVTGDGGVDVRGALAIAGAIRVPIAVQAKRYKGVVHAPVVREFRGSLSPGEIGIVVTTGEFSSGAIEEATRSGCVPIYLIHGTELIRLVEELRPPET